MKFSDKLAKLRMNYGYSQEELAEKLSVSRQAVSKWELGTALPDTENVLAISEVFDISLDFLLKEGITIQDEGLDRVVLKFLYTVQDMDAISKDLLAILKDGCIDEEERIRIEEIVQSLDNITEIINEIKSKISS